MKQKDLIIKYLLVVGIIAPLLLGGVSYALALTSPGFDLARHANSQLVLGPNGWVQTANFIIVGILLVVFAIGLRLALKGKPGGVLIPLLIGIYGLFGAVIVGFNPADPQFGYPLGTPQGYPGLDNTSLSAKIHGIAGGIGFLAFALAAFVLARYFVWAKQIGWAVASGLVGLAVFGTLAFLFLSAGGAADSFNYIPVWSVGTAIWLYVSAVAWKIRRNFGDALEGAD